ncbi:MAG TPA: hypothetical protein VEB00_01400 [Clostridia bacterium]|nr:hypothetical protein [Clostridia bacterium]
MVMPSWSMIESLLNDRTEYLLNNNHNKFNISDGLFSPFELSVDALSGKYGALYVTPEIPASKLSERLEENLHGIAREVGLSDNVKRFVAAAYESPAPNTLIRLGYAARGDDRTFYMNKLRPRILYDFLTGIGMADFAGRIKKTCFSFCITDEHLHNEPEYLKNINGFPYYLGMSFGYAGAKTGKYKAYIVLPECSIQSLYDYIEVSGGKEWAQTLIGASRLIYGDCQFYRGGRITLTISSSSLKPGVSFYLGDHASDSAKIILCFALCSFLQLPLTHIASFASVLSQIFDWKHTKQLSYFSIEPHGPSGARLRLWLRSGDA